MDSLGLIQQVLCGWFCKNQAFGGVSTIESAVLSVLIEGRDDETKDIQGPRPIHHQWTIVCLA